jgi:UDP-2,3-diacylglucosamine hydrolase
VKHTLFVSDLHLAAERPHISAVFFDFVRDVASRAQALYVLGDLFEYWVGDDDLDDPLNSAVAHALGELAESSVAVYFLHGNRDFLIGETFVARARATLISDPTKVNLYGTPTVLMHGDTLCTDDVDYQKFRATARDPKFQAQFLAQPIEARRARVGQLREINAQAKQAKSAEIMDVAVTAVEDTLRRYDYPRLIHGHTHRPARHVHVVDGHTCERWVLNDWYERGGYLHCDVAGCRAVSL